MMRRGLGLILVCVLVLVGLFWLFAPTSPPPEAPEEMEEAPEVAAPPEVPVESRTVIVPRVSIVGRVFDGTLKGLGGLEVSCGAESVTSDAEGAFKFPTAARPGRQDFSTRRGGEELARWSAVFTGDVSAASEVDLYPGATAPPSAPGRIRWTLTLPQIGRARTGDAKRGSSASLTPIARVRAVFLEEWGTTGLARVEGSTDLPDGAHLDAALYFDGERVVASTERPEVRGGRFQALIRFPDDMRIHSTTYQVHLTFASSQEDPVQVELWRKERPELGKLLAGEQVVVVDAYAGDPGEEREENRKIERYYRTTLTQVEDLRRMLTAWSRDARTLTQGWDPRILGDRAALKEAWFGDPLLDAEGKFSLDAWRRFLDEGWRPEVLGLLARHTARSGQKYRSAENLLKEVLGRILVLSKIESVLVYQGMGLTPHPRDFFLDADLPEGDRMILVQILDKELASLQRFKTIAGGGQP